MNRARLLAAVATVAAASVPVACGESRQAPQTRAQQPRTLVTVWSSFPHRGPGRLAARGYERAIRGALHDLRLLNPGTRIRYVALDSSSAQANGWDPAVVAANARKAARNASTIAYIGEADSGATAVALPILNQADVLMITPTATARGLTLGGNGSGPGEPFQYYPTGRRNLVRLVPQDSIQSGLIADRLRSDRCGSVLLVHDRTNYGVGLNDLIASRLRVAGVRFSAVEVPDQPESGRIDLRTAQGSDCIAYLGEAGATAVSVVGQLAGISPKARLYGSSGLADRSFASPRFGGISERVASRMSLFVPLGGLAQYPPVGRSLMRKVVGMPERLVGPGVPSAYAAGELVARSVAATRRLGESVRSRRAYIRLAVGRTHGSEALGVYVVVPRGDTTVKRYGLYGIRSGEIRFREQLTWRGG